MKTKHALIIFALGFIFSLIGALFKLMHWPSANIILLTSTILQVSGTLIFIYKLATYPKIKDFLNW